MNQEHDEEYADVEHWRNHIKIGECSQIVFADNQRATRRLNNESVHLTFTSPPYWNFVEYASGRGSGTEDEYIEYIRNLKTLFRIIEEKTVPGGRFIINVSNMNSRIAVEGKESFYYPIVGDVTRSLIEVGFTFFDECIWVKGGANVGQFGDKPLYGSYPYPPTPKMLNSMFENILIFKKPGKRERPILKYKQESKININDWLQWTQAIWHIPPDQKTDHPAPFPMEIAKRIIKLYSFVGDRVIDPFAGSGTTIIAAEKWGREGIGFEIARDYENEIKAKAEENLSQLSIPGIGE